MENKSTSLQCSSNSPDMRLAKFNRGGKSGKGFSEETAKRPDRTTTGTLRKLRPLCARERAS